MPLRKKIKDICTVPSCNYIADTIYYGYPVCHGHWLKHIDQSMNLDNIFNIDKRICRLEGC